MCSYTEFVMSDFTLTFKLYFELISTDGKSDFLGL